MTRQAALDRSEPLTTAPEDTDLMGAGRSLPREVLRTVEHDLWFSGSPDTYPRGHGVVAHCGPCDWHRSFEAGHDLPDFINLLAQHAGLDVAKRLCIDTLARYGAEHGEPVLAAVPELPPCGACGTLAAERELLRVLRNDAEEDAGVYCVDLIACSERVRDRAGVSAP